MFGEQAGEMDENGENGKVDILVARAIKTRESGRKEKPRFYQPNLAELRSILYMTRKTGICEVQR